MKFQFKLQPFQTEAAESVVRVFTGQPKQGESKYRRDVGKREATIFDYTDDFDSGYLNEEVQLGRAELLKNIRAVQTAINLVNSTELAAGLGAVSLDIDLLLCLTYSSTFKSAGITLYRSPTMP